MTGFNFTDEQFAEWRRVCEAAIKADEECRATEHRRNDPRIAYLFTFTPVVVKQLLYYAQNWHNALEKGRTLQGAARKALGIDAEHKARRS